MARFEIRRSAAVAGGTFDITVGGDVPFSAVADAMARSEAIVDERIAAAIARIGEPVTAPVPPAPRTRRRRSIEDEGATGSASASTDAASGGPAVDAAIPPLSDQGAGDPPAAAPAPAPEGGVAPPAQDEAPGAAGARPGDPAIPDNIVPIAWTSSIDWKGEAPSEEELIAVRDYIRETLTSAEHGWVAMQTMLAAVEFFTKWPLERCRRVLNLLAMREDVPWTRLDNERICLPERAAALA
jgi:hypothetical protein